MSAVRPEFGPTLPELVRPRLAAMRPALRYATLAAMASFAAAVVWFAAIRDNGHRDVVVREPVAFNFGYNGKVHRIKAGPGQVIRLRAGTETMAVGFHTLPAYEGLWSGFLPVYTTTTLAPQMARRYPGFVLRYDGSALVIPEDGYEIGFEFRRGGRTWYGRRILLIPEPTARRAVEILLLGPRAPGRGRPEALARQPSPLRDSIFGFRLGTDKAKL
jgi:hypothetical protein